MSLLPRAYIVHQLRGRLRLKIPEKRQEHGYFAELQKRLMELSGISEACGNATTGSLVLVHPTLRFDELLPQLAELGLFEIQDAPESPQSAIKPLLSGMSLLDETIAEISSGSVNLRDLALIGVLGLAAYQLYRGNILGPALPLLISAVDMARKIPRQGEDSEI